MYNNPYRKACAQALGTIKSCIIPGRNPSEILERICNAIEEMEDAHSDYFIKNGIHDVAKMCKDSSDLFGSLKRHFAHEAGLPHVTTRE